MMRTDLAEAVLSGWAWLDAAQRQRFFEALLDAALRLDRLELRAWLRRRLKNPPLAAPIDPARFAISDVDVALIMRAAGKAATGSNSDEANGGLDLIGRAMGPWPRPLPQRGREADTVAERAGPLQGRGLPAVGDQSSGASKLGSERISLIFVSAVFVWG
jgi:hypothetical protein